MRLASKDKDHIRYIRQLYLQGKWIAMCNEIWYYGEFDFAYDFLRHIQFRYKNEEYSSQMYREVIDIYFSGQYNPNLMNPSQGEPRRDSWMEFYLGEKPDAPQRKTKNISKKLQKILEKNNI